MTGPSGDRRRRRARLVLPLCLAGAVVLGCAGPGVPEPPGGPAPVGAPALGGGPPVAAPVPTPSRARAAVDATVPAATRRDDVTLGVAVLDRATGTIETNEAGTRPLRAASITKLITAADLLDGRAAGRVPVDPADDDLVRRALGPSDDGAMNALWSRDGVGGVRRVAGALGLSATAPASDPAQWGETTTSARDVTVLLAALAARPAADRDLVLGALAAAPPVATDGFDQAFGLLDPATRGAAAAKQGWLCCLQSSVDLHSAGLPDPGGRYVVALMSNQPFGYDVARDVLDGAAGAVRATLDGA